jgi:hypothetical protein
MGWRRGGSGPTKESDWTATTAVAQELGAARPSHSADGGAGESAALKRPLRENAESVRS